MNTTSLVDKTGRKPTATFSLTRQIIALLPPGPQQDAFTLLFIEQEPLAKVAAILGMSPQEVMEKFLTPGQQLLAQQHRILVDLQTGQVRRLSQAASAPPTDLATPAEPAQVEEEPGQSAEETSEEQDDEESE